MSVENDPLSTASAGLYALGVPAPSRLATLELLATVLDHADAKGRVTFSSSLWEAEERLGVEAAMEAYTLLESLGVIRQTSMGWLVPGFEAHHGPAGAAAASLAVLRSHMNATADWRPRIVEPAVPDADIVPIHATPRRRMHIPATAAGLAAAVAALFGVLQLAPARQAPTSASALRAAAGQVPTSSVSGGRATPSDTTAATLAAQTPSPTSLAGLPGAIAASAAPTNPLCSVASPTSAITQVDVVPVGFPGGAPEQFLWTAVVTGSVTNRESFPVEILSVPVTVTMPDGTTLPGFGTLVDQQVGGRATAPFVAIVTLGSFPTQVSNTAILPIDARRVGC